VRSLSGSRASTGSACRKYFGEKEDTPQYWAAPSLKADSLVAMVDRLQPGVNLVVTHVGLDDPELGALLDMTPTNRCPT